MEASLEALSDALSVGEQRIFTDIAYSKYQMDQCKTFGTEPQCMMLLEATAQDQCEIKG